MKGWLRIVSVLAIGAILAACGDGRTRPPQVQVTVVHAAPTYPDINFYRGAGSRGLAATIPFRGGQVFDFDVDTYNYRLTITTTSQTEEVRREFTESLSPDTQYFYILTESGGSLEELILSEPEFSADSADTEFSIVDASETTGAIDVYVEPPGTDLLGVAPKATLTFRGSQAPMTAPPGDYVVTVTTAGVAADVLYQSSTLTFSAGRTRALVITGSGGAGTGTLALIHATDQVVSWSDVNAPAAVRLVNGAGDRAAHDVYINSDFSAPLIGAQAFGTASDYAELTPGTVTFTITPQANPSVIENEFTQTMAPAVLNTLALTGESGSVVGFMFPDDRRVTTNEARLRVFNLVNYYAALDIYIAQPGTDLSTVSPVFQLTAQSASSRLSFAPAELELTLRDTVTGTTVFGPQPLSLPTQGIYTIFALDAGDGVNADILLLDDFL